MRRRAFGRVLLVAALLIGLLVGQGVFGASITRAESEEAGEGLTSNAPQQVVERGPVRVEVAIRPERPVIGDVIELDLVVIAEEGVEVLMPEFGEALGRFEIVDFAPSQSLDADGRSVARQKYRLQPSRSGAQSIPSLRIEFVDRRPGMSLAPDGEDAFEILTERVTLEIEPILAADAPLELEPAHADLPPRGTGATPPWVWVLGALALLAAAAPFLWRSFVAARVRQRRRSAYEIARGELDGLLTGGLPDADSMDAFYVQLSQIVRGYLENRFGLRSPELTTQEFLTEMGRSPDLARSHQQLLRDFLETADLVKFAGLRPNADDVSESIASAERFLEETRNQQGGESGAERAGEVGEHA